MGDSSGSMFYGVIGFLVVYFVGYFICRVYDKMNIQATRDKHTGSKTEITNVELAISKHHNNNLHRFPAFVK